MQTLPIAAMRPLPRPLRSRLVPPGCVRSQCLSAHDEPLPGSRIELARGTTSLNSVKAPSSVATSSVPPCCLTTMSWLRDRPRPVPSPAGLVVKNGLNIFASASSGMPVPLSRMAISTRSSWPRVEAISVGS